MHCKSPIQEAYSLKDSYEWGRFIIYTEYAEDRYASRSVRVYENGYITQYDREHWEDQFGNLPDFRFGVMWKKHWGEPEYISSAEFEYFWAAAKLSSPFSLRIPPKYPCTWIELFQSGKLKDEP